MNVIIITGIILICATVLAYIYKNKVKQLWKKHKKKIMAIILGSSMASAGLFGISSFEINIDDYLIDELSDYEDLGFNTSRIVNPIVYKREVLCEGHLPLGFKFKTLSKDVDAGSNFISASQFMKSNMNSLSLDYKVLTNETFTYEEPVYKVESFTYERDNKTVSDTKKVLTGYKTVEDYHYTWKDWTPKVLKQGDVIVIDIVSNFKASTSSKRVDIIPTLSVQSKSDISYSKTYSEYAWWNSNWMDKKEITINHSQVEGIVTNFPVCINITDTDLRDDAQSDGDDIAFTDSTETTQLNHEIEYYDNTTGKLVAWVNVTSISSSVDTSIYMYYNNGAAANQEDVTNTWHASYDAVYHFYEGEGTSVNDSTSNNHDGTLDFSDHWVTHNFGYAYDFDGTDDECEVSWSPNYGTDSVCIMAYAKSDDVTNFQTIAGWAEYAVNQEELSLLFNDEELRLITRDIDNDAVRVDKAASDSTSYYTVGVLNRSTDNVCTYINGVVTVLDSSSVGALSFDDNFGIGESFGNNQGKQMDGIIDEVRVYSGLLNRSYIITTYNSLSNAVDGSFFSVGAEDLGETTFEIQGLPAYNITFFGNQGDTVWCNSSGVNNETMQLYQSMNSTQEVTGHDIYIENMTDGSGNWFSAANITLYASSDNTSFGVPSDDDGNGNGVFIDGGSIITLNSTTWNAGTMSTNPYNIENGTSDTVYVRFKADIPGSESVDRMYYSSNDTYVWAMPFYVNFTGNNGV